MKRILLGLLCLAPSVIAMEKAPTKAPIELSDKQKTQLIKDLFESAMTTEEKQAISGKLFDGKTLTKEDLSLLEAYDLLPKEKEATELAFDDLISRFIDVQALGMGIAGCSLSSTGIKKPGKNEILKVAIKALLLKDLEVTIKEHEGTLGEFFDQKKLKKALKKIVEEHATENIDEDSLTDYHLRIKRSIKLEEFAKVLSPEEYEKLIVNGKVNIAYLMSLFGFIEEGFHDLDQLNKVIDKLLMNESIENHYILNCINFAVILKGLGCKDEEMPDIDGLRSLIAQIISWMTEEDGQTFNNFLRREGDHWRRTTKGNSLPDAVKNSNN